jgi:polyhydroxyalkanoate synthesis regulator phasin
LQELDVPTENDVASLEQRVASLEKQVAELEKEKAELTGLGDAEEGNRLD